MGLLEQPGQRSRLLGKRLPCHAEPHRDGDQPGLRAVVQVTLDAAQFRAVGVEHA